MPSRVANAKHRSFEQMHETFLLIEVRLVGQFVECKQRVVLRKNRSHKRRTIKIVATGALLHEVHKRLGACEYRFKMVAIKEKIANNVFDAWVKLELLEIC